MDCPFCIRYIHSNYPLLPVTGNSHWLNFDASCQVFFLSPHTPIGCVRLAHFARIRLLCHALLISLLILEKNRLFCSLPNGLESGQVSCLLKIPPRVNTKLIPSFEYLTLSDACLTQYLLSLFVSDLTEEEVLQMAVQLSLQEM